MAKLFGINIPQLVAQSLPGMLPGVLNVVTEGTRDANNPGAGNQPTTVAVAFKGFADKHTKTATGKVLQATHTVAILADTCKVSGVPVEPKPGHTIQLTGDPQLGSTVLTIVDEGVERDPASAMWLCHVRTPGV